MTGPLLRLHIKAGPMMTYCAPSRGSLPHYNVVEADGVLNSVGVGGTS